MSTIDWSNTIKINYFGGCIWCISFCVDPGTILKELEKENRRRKFIWKTLKIAWNFFYLWCVVIVLLAAFQTIVGW